MKHAATSGLPGGICRRQKCLADFRPHLKSSGANSGTQPCQHLVRAGVHRNHGGFQHPRQQAPPACMRGRDDITGGRTQQHRQAVRSQHRAGGSRTAAPLGIGDADTVRPALLLSQRCHAPATTRKHATPCGSALASRSPVGRHCAGAVTHMVRQVEAVVGGRAAPALARGAQRQHSGRGRPLWRNKLRLNKGWYCWQAAGLPVPVRRSA